MIDKHIEWGDVACSLKLIGCHTHDGEVSLFHLKTWLKFRIVFFFFITLDNVQVYLSVNTLDGEVSLCQCDELAH